MEELARAIRNHVLHSNAMEGIYAEDGDPLFDRHLEAAAYTAIQAQPGRFGWYVYPREIHRRLLYDIEEFAGEYRNSDVMVVDQNTGHEYLMPEASKVPDLMRDWEVSYMRHWMVIQNYGASHRHTWIERRAEFYHDWYLCVHPHVDGNGRTARLIYNAIRIAGGLPWQVIDYHSAPEYVARIRDFENRIFKPWYKYVSA